MKSIKVTILGRQYPLRIREEDEQIMYEIAEYVDDRFKTFKRDLTGQSETTIMVLTCLSIAEELFMLKRDGMKSGSQESVEEINTAIKQLLTEITGEMAE